ncbi:MAG: hypothetical protein GX998_02700 [Firmicutes bacterium]|nr:hypothetical protein [Bacillota bacterium]
MVPSIAYIRLHHFYALLEAKHNHRLWQQPFVVTRAQRIIDISPQAARLHITTNMGLRQARLACPDLQIIDAQADPVPAAEKFWDICADLTPLVEPEGHNSAFLDLSGQGELTAVSENIIHQLRWKLEFPFHIGIAPSKLVAKIAYGETAHQPTSVQQPFTWHRGRGQHSSPVELKGNAKTKIANTARYCLIIPRTAVETFLAPLPINRLWLWPDKIHQQLQNLGIYTIGQLRQVPKLQLQKQLGEAGEQLYDAARGIDHTSVQGVYPPEAIQTYFQLPPEVEGYESWEALTIHLLPLIESAVTDLQRQAKACTRLRLLVQYDTLPEQCWDKSFKDELQTANQFLQAIKGLLTQKAWPAPITGIRLMLMGLKPASLGQLRFASQIFGAQHQRELQQILSSLQARFGANSIFVAADISIPRRERMLQLLANHQ